MFQVDQLIIIGGPPCAGKSFLIEKIQQGDYPSLQEQLGIAIPSSWTYVPAYQLANIRQPIIKRLVVHYDFYTHYSQNNGFNYLHELINNSDRIIILTLCVPPKILIKRLNLRILVLLKSLFHLSVYREKRLHRVLRKFSKNFMREWKKLNAYKHGFSVFLYERWFNYFNQSSVTTHWMLDFNQSNIVIAHPYIKDKVEIFNWR